MDAVGRKGVREREVRGPRGTHVVYFHLRHPRLRGDVTMTIVTSLPAVTGDDGPAKEDKTAVAGWLPKYRDNPRNMQRMLAVEMLVRPIRRVQRPDAVSYQRRGACCRR